MSGRQYTKKSQGFASDIPSDFGFSSKVKPTPPHKGSVRKMPAQPGYIQGTGKSKKKGC